MRGPGKLPLRHTWPAMRSFAMRVRDHRATVLARRAVNEFRTDHCQQMAAAISFHLLFSVFPLTIAAAGIIGLVTRDPHARHAVITTVLNVVPLSQAGKSQLADLLDSVSRQAGALGLLGGLGIVWSASGVMAAVRTALNAAWDTDVRRPFLRGKLVDLALVGGVFLVTGATLGLTIAAGFARAGVSHVSDNLQVLAPLAGAVASAGVFILSTALLFATFCLLYRLVPAVPTRIRGVWPGALVAAAGFEGLQYGFSAYLAHFAHYNKVYGSLGAVIAFLFFVYLASMIFLLGAEVASEYPRLDADRPGPDGRAGGDQAASPPGAG